VASAGLAASGIARMRAVMAGHVERGAMPGLITLVARGPHAHVDPGGRRAAAVAHARPSVATDTAPPWRMDAALRRAPADASARRAMDVQHRRAGARRPPPAGHRTATGSRCGGAGRIRAGWSRAGWSRPGVVST